MLVFGDPNWITKLHYAFQDKDNLVSIHIVVLLPAHEQCSTPDDGAVLCD